MTDATDAPPPPDDEPDLPPDREVDLLFVIDNSASMTEEQASLATGVRELVEGLLDLHADVRVGITDTDNGNPWCSGGTGGALRLSSCHERLDDFIWSEGAGHLDGTYACLDACQHDAIDILPTSTHLDERPKPRPWLEFSRGRSNLAALDPSEALACALPLGIRGCGFEQPLESAYKAIGRAEARDERQYGFIRPDSVLVLVFVTDELDCSSTPDAASIFSAEGDRVFWSDPDAAQPTSAVCRNAGVACSGGPGTYEDCRSQNYAHDGVLGAAPGDAVLHPMTRYFDRIQELEEIRRARYGGQEVIVRALTGVPPGYAEGLAEVVYQDSETNPQFQSEYGIGPGCQGPAGAALAPVRLREFADLFALDSRNLHSICAPDYGPFFRALLADIGRQLP